MMVDGLRGGFAAIKSMIERGIPLPPLNRWDYLDIFNPLLTPCGSGFNYVAAGPDGIASCHEALYGMDCNIDDVTLGENMFDIVNAPHLKNRHLLYGPNISFSNEQLAQLLQLHGGAGCPRTRIEENGLSTASSIAQYLYGQIFSELVSLETMRQLKEQEQLEGWILEPATFKGKTVYGGMSKSTFGLYYLRDNERDGFRRWRELMNLPQGAVLEGVPVEHFVQSVPACPTGGRYPSRRGPLIGIHGTVIKYSVGPIDSTEIVNADRLYLRPDLEEVFQTTGIPQPNFY